MPPSILHTALAGFIARLEQEWAMNRTKLDLGREAIAAEFPDWTEAQSSGYIAGLKARSDTLALTIYRLERLLKQAGDT